MDRQTEWTDEQNARKRIKHAKDKKKNWVKMKIYLKAKKEFFTIASFFGTG